MGCYQGNGWKQRKTEFNAFLATIDSKYRPPITQKWYMWNWGAVERSERPVSVGARGVEKWPPSLSFKQRCAYQRYWCYSSMLHSTCIHQCH